MRNTRLFSATSNLHENPEATVEVEASDTEVNSMVLERAVASAVDAEAEPKNQSHEQKNMSLSNFLKSKTRFYNKVHLYGETETEQGKSDTLKSNKIKHNNSLIKKIVY